MFEEIVDAIKQVIADNSREDFHYYKIGKTDLEDVAIQIYNAISDIKEGFDDED